MCDDAMLATYADDIAAVCLWLATDFVTSLKLNLKFEFQTLRPDVIRHLTVVGLKAYRTRIIFVRMAPSTDMVTLLKYEHRM